MSFEKVSDVCVACDARDLLGPNATNFVPSANAVAFAPNTSTLLACAGNPVSVLPFFAAELGHCRQKTYRIYSRVSREI